MVQDFTNRTFSIASTCFHEKTPAFGSSSRNACKPASCRAWCNCQSLGFFFADAMVAKRNAILSIKARWIYPTKNPSTSSLPFPAIQAFPISRPVPVWCMPFHGSTISLASRCCFRWLCLFGSFQFAQLFLAFLDKLQAADLMAERVYGRNGKAPFWKRKEPLEETHFLLPFINILPWILEEA